VQRVRNIFTNETSFALDKAIKKYGDYDVTRCIIYRTPVQSFVQKFLGVITFGQFQKNIYSNYDNVYHLYVIIEMINKGGQYAYVLTEKTPNITIEQRRGLETGEKNAEGIEVVLPHSVNFKDVVDLAKKENPQGIQKYSADKFNCQQYILSLINAMYEMNGMKTPNNIFDFIYQDPMKLFKDLPKTAKLANAITDIAHFANRVVGGKEVKRK